DVIGLFLKLVNITSGFACWFSEWWIGAASTEGFRPGTVQYNRGV
ncbi:MAG: hypothetical protein ACI97A_004379, partial [Planctomycetota bacterium]